MTNRETDTSVMDRLRNALEHAFRCVKSQV